MTAEIIRSGEPAAERPPVLLLHSSVAGARQWRALSEMLADRATTLAANLIGYGASPSWPELREGPRPQRLDDQCAAIEAAIADVEGPLRVVGHSFGGAVAMKLAARLGPRVERLALIEPNPFYLLHEGGRDEAFAEIAALRGALRDAAERGDMAAAAERFSEYWAGRGSWAATSPERRVAFAAALEPNFFEWDAVMMETTPLRAWGALLPERTTLIIARKTLRPIADIADLLLRANKGWRRVDIADGGHMAPLSRPDLVNPAIAAALFE